MDCGGSLNWRIEVDLLSGLYGDFRTVTGPRDTCGSNSSSGHQRQKDVDVCRTAQLDLSTCLGCIECSGGGQLDTAAAAVGTAQILSCQRDAAEDRQRVRDGEPTGNVDEGV